MTSIFQSRARRPGKRSSSFMLAALALGAAGVGAPPAALAQSAPIVNDYQLVGTVAPDAWLTSSIDCGLVRCDVKNAIVSKPVDALVVVEWRDDHGKTLVAADNSYLSNFWEPGFFSGYLEATSWTKGAFGSAFFPPTPVVKHGTADFTGSIGILNPCGGLVCQNADYYDWPASPFNVPVGGGAAPAPARMPLAPAPAGDASLATLTGTLEVIGVDLATPDDLNSGPSVTLFEFRSAVEQVGGEYRYRYSVTNLTDSTVIYDWAEAGLSGELGAQETAERSVTSALAPAVVSTLPLGTFTQTDPFLVEARFSGELGMLAPVPEPETWAMFAAGLGVLLVLGVKRRGGVGRG